MAEITAALVKELRERSGVGMMDCKKALVETNGDIDAAIDWLRAKGLSERTVVLKHVLRNSLIPVVTVIALGLPVVFGGALITEEVFKVNGIGQLLILAIHANDIPMVMTLTFIFAILIVSFTLIADLLYGVLDPRIRYD